MAKSAHLALASLLVSAGVLLAALRLGLAAGVPAVRVAFFALLPTAVGALAASERRGFAAFEALWELLARALGPPGALKRSDPDAELRDARAELFRAFGERVPRAINAAKARRSAVESGRTEVMSSATTNKSLYEQVRENLVDHAFHAGKSAASGRRAAADAPVYLMDPTSRTFLKINHHRKLVFTNTPDASCLFQVVKGKTHHWGFHSAIHQRYIGQNFVGRMVVTSKKLNAWEAFRVLQRRDDESGAGSDEGAAGSAVSPRIYLILCSARFGKGMWLAKNRRIPAQGALSNRTDSHSSSASSNGLTSSSSHSELTELTSPPHSSNSSSRSHSGHGPNGPDRNSAVYLSKNFANALPLVYSSDLTAFDALLRADAAQGNQVTPSTSPTRSGMTKSMSLPSARLRQHLLRSCSQIPVSQGTAFQPPVLVKRERAAVHLPWILDARNTNFFELNEADMTEVVSTVIANCDLPSMIAAIKPTENFSTQHVEPPTQSSPPPVPAAPRAPKSRSAVRSFPSTLSSTVVAGIASISASASSRGTNDFQLNTQQERVEASASSASATSPPKAPLSAPTKTHVPLSEWHSHPHFGYVRKLSYRPPSPTVGMDSVLDMVARRRAGATSVRSIAIDQYNAVAIDNEAAPTKLTFLSKVYTLSIPYSNCFSIETLMEFEATSQETQIVPAGVEGKSSQSGAASAPAVKFRCRTGVYFSRETMFAPQIRRGAADGVTSTAEAFLQLIKETRAEWLHRSRQNPSSSTGIMPPLASDDSDRAYISRIFTLEIVKALVASICDAPETRSALPIQLPWKVFASPAQSSNNSGFRFELGKNSKTPATIAAAPSSTSSLTTATAAPFFESAPEQFSRVLEEYLGPMVTPRLFFGSLLSDECAFFQVTRSQQSGNMDVDVGAWGVLPQQTHAPPTSSLGSSRGRPAAAATKVTAYVRKQVLSMPLSGVPGVEVAHLEDYQYHAFVDRRGDTDSRLEFGMKLFVPDLPDGDNSSVRLLICTMVFVVRDHLTYVRGGGAQIEVLVVVERDYKKPGNILRVYFAVPTFDPSAKRAVIANPHVIAGALRGLKGIWKAVAHAITRAASRAHGEDDTDADVGADASSLDVLEAARVQQKLRADGELPTHDELASRLVEAIAAAYS